MTTNGSEIPIEDQCVKCGQSVVQVRESGQPNDPYSMSLFSRCSECNQPLCHTHGRDEESQCNCINLLPEHPCPDCARHCYNEHKSHIIYPLPIRGFRCTWELDQTGSNYSSLYADQVYECQCTYQKCGQINRGCRCKCHKKYLYWHQPEKER